MTRLIFVFFALCFSLSSLSQGVSPTDEAVVIGRQTFTTSGDFFFSEMPSTSRFRSSINSQVWYTDRTISQYFGTKQFILPDDVSVADGLNGITWQGKLQFISKATRSFHWSTDPTDKVTYHGWSKWLDNDTITYKMTRYGTADWRVEPFPSNGNHPPKSVSQSDVQLVINRPLDRGASIPPVEY